MDIQLFDETKSETHAFQICSFEDLEVMTEAYTQIPIHDQIFFNKDRQLYDTRKDLFSSGIENGGYVYVTRKTLLRDPNKNIKDQMVLDFLHSSHNCFYLMAEYNDYSFKILIDSGAQTSVMTDKFVKMLGIESSIDKRFHGKIQGVASQTKMLGVITNCILKLDGDIHVPANFQVIESQVNTVPILGMDFLLNHKCKIDFISREIEIDRQIVKVMNDVKLEKMRGLNTIKTSVIKSIYKMNDFMTCYSEELELFVKLLTTQRRKNIKPLILTAKSSLK